MLASGSGQHEFKSIIRLSEERLRKTDFIKNPFPFKYFTITLLIVFLFLEYCLHINIIFPFLLN